MPDNRTFISSVVKMDLGPNSTFQAKESNNIEPYQFAPKNLFWAKFYITSQGMQEHRTFISSLLKIDFWPNSTFQAKICRNIESFQSAPRI